MDQLQAHIAVVDAIGLDMGGEYIAEAEHQEGAEYWQRFSTQEALLEDVTEWRNNVAQRELFTE